MAVIVSMYFTKRSPRRTSLCSSAGDYCNKSVIRPTITTDFISSIPKPQAVYCSRFVTLQIFVLRHNITLKKNAQSFIYKSCIPHSNSSVPSAQSYFVRSHLPLMSTHVPSLQVNSVRGSQEGLGGSGVSSTKFTINHQISRRHRTLIKNTGYQIYFPLPEVLHFPGTPRFLSFASGKNSRSSSKKLRKRIEGSRLQSAAQKNP